MTDNSKQLGTENIFKLLVRFSLPAITAYLVHALYNIIDRIVVGHEVGALGIAGLTLVFPVTIFLFSFGIMIGIGSASLVSIYLGENKKDEAEAVVANAIAMLIISAAVLTGTCLCLMDEILDLLQASAKIRPYARDYMEIIIWGTPMSMIGFSMGSLIRAQGDPKTAMYLTIFSAVTNIILDPIMVFGLDMGVRGAAWATVIAQSSSMIWALWHFQGPRCSLKIRCFSLQKPIVVRIMSVGMAASMIDLTSSLQNGLINTQLQIYSGDMAVAAMGIIFSVNILMMMLIFGISDGMQPIFGYNFGAGQFGRVRQALTLSISCASKILFVLFIAVQMMPQAIAALFCNDPALIKMTAHGLRIFMASMPVIGFQVIVSLYFQAIGRGGLATFLGLLRQGIILIPTLIILPKYWGLDGIWAAGPVSDALAAIITGIWFLIELKYLSEHHTHAKMALNHRI